MFTVSYCPHSLAVHFTNSILGVFSVIKHDKRKTGRIPRQPNLLQWPELFEDVLYLALVTVDSQIGDMHTESFLHVGRERATATPAATAPAAVPVTRPGARSAAAHYVRSELNDA